MTAIPKADRAAADRILNAAVRRAVTLTRAGEHRAVVVALLTAAVVVALLTAAVVVALLTAATTAADVLLDPAVKS